MSLIRPTLRFQTLKMNRSSSSKLDSAEPDFDALVSSSVQAVSGTWTISGGNFFYNSYSGSTDPTSPYSRSPPSPCVQTPPAATAAHPDSPLNAQTAGSAGTGSHQQHHHSASTSGSSFGPGGTVSNGLGQRTSSTVGGTMHPPTSLNPRACYSRTGSQHVSSPLSHSGCFPHRGDPAESPMSGHRRFSGESLSSSGSSTSAYSPPVALQGFSGSSFSSRSFGDGPQRLSAPSSSLAQQSLSTQLARSGYRHGSMETSGEGSERQLSRFHPYSSPPQRPYSSSSSSHPFSTPSFSQFGFPCPSRLISVRGVHGGRFGVFPRTHGEGGTYPQSQYLRGLVSQSGHPSHASPPTTATDTTIPSSSMSVGRQLSESSPSSHGTPTLSTTAATSTSPDATGSYLSDSPRSCDANPSDMKNFLGSEDRKQWTSCRFQTGRSASQNGTDVTCFPPARGVSHRWSHLGAGALACPFPGTPALRRRARSGFLGSSVDAEAESSSSVTVEALLRMRGRRT